MAVAAAVDVRENLPIDSICSSVRLLMQNAIAICWKQQPKKYVDGVVSEIIQSKENSYTLYNYD